MNLENIVKSEKKIEIYNPFTVKDGSLAKIANIGFKDGPFWKGEIKVTSDIFYNCQVFGLANANYVFIQDSPETYLALASLFAGKRRVVLDISDRCMYGFKSFIERLGIKDSIIYSNEYINRTNSRLHAIMLDLDFLTNEEVFKKLDIDIVDVYNNIRKNIRDLKFK